MGAPKCEHGDQDRGPRGCRICARARALKYAQSDKGKKRAAAYFQANYDRVGMSKNAQKTHCPQGHEYSAENTYVWSQKSGIQRRCKICVAEKNVRYIRQRAENGGSHTEGQWIALCEGWEYTCAHCRKEAPLTRDHIIPVSKGGTSDISNIQPLCLPCNSRKGTKLISA